MGVKLTSAETTVNKSAAAAASGTKNKILVAPWTSTYAKLQPLGTSNVATTLTDSSSTVPISITSVAISVVTITDSNWNPLDDTAVSTAGGYFKITGIGFQSGCVVYAQGTAASSVQFVSPSELRVQTPTLTAGTLHLYVVNPDGSVAITLTRFKVSGVPNWITTSPLTTQLLDTAFTIPLSANSDSTITYSVASGSSLPSGVSLTANGVLSGTVTGLSVDTTYSFNLVATDVELQDTTKTFSVSITLGDAFFNLTTLLLNAESNTWITDGSTNKFLPTVGNDTRPVGFSPYNTNWSQSFAAGNYFQVSGNNNLAFGTSDFTIECFFYSTDVSTSFFIYDSRTTINQAVPCILGGGGTVQYYVSGATRITSGTIVNNQWYHLVLSRVSGSTRMFLNGVQTGSTYTDSTTYINPSSRPMIGTNGDGATFAFYGYISNLRVLNGTGTTSPTVPTSPLTVVTNTQLLTLQNNIFKDNGPNAFTIAAAGSPSARSFSPFTETDLISGSAYFDGTGDYLSYADSSALELGSGDFCVECWVYPTSVSATGVIIDKRSGTYGPLLLWRSTSTAQLYMSSNNSSWDMVNGFTVGTLIANQWHHIAVYRVSGVIYTSFNGVVSVANASNTSTPYNNAGAWYLGTQTDGSTNPFTGYISNLRIVVGSGVYTSSNTAPPATSLTAITNTQLLSLQNRRGENNSRFVDESTTRAITTRSGNATQGSFTPFSPAGWSNYFDGTGDYLTVTRNAVFYPGSNADFTVEAWVYLTATPVNNGIIIGSGSFGTNDDWNFHINTSRQAGLFIKATSTNYDNTGVTLSLNTWYHVAAARYGTSSNNLTIFVNGVGQSFTTNASLNNSQSYNITIGLDTSGTATFTGYISNLRMVNNTAVYTSNTTLTVPTSTLTAVANTVLLTCQDNRFRDNSTANNGSGFLITRNGDAKIQPFSPFRNSGTYTPSIHGGSAYFDGSADYLYITKSDTVTLGTNDHCIEFWMYPDGIQSRYSELWSYSIGASSGATNTYYGSIGNDSGGGINVLGGPLSGSWAVTLTMAAPSTEYNAALNGWTHFVLTRKGSAYRLFLNGVLKAYTTYSGSIIAQGSSFSLGWDGSDPFTYYKGWMSNFRVINGSIPTAYQTSNTTVGTAIFTPPTSVPAYEANTVLQMDFTNGALVDVTTRNVYETVGAVLVSNTQSKFGIGSVSLPGALTAYLKTPSNPSLDFGTGDFTVETWVYFNTVASDQGLFGGSTTNAWEIRWRTSTGLNLGRLNTAFDSTFAWSPSANIWYHVAVTRSDANTRAFINGTQIGTTSTNSNTYNSGALFYIGLTDTSNNPFNGYMDDIRITKGTARYTSNFTPSTTPFFTR